MELITILNRCHRLRGLVYEEDRPLAAPAPGADSQLLPGSKLISSGVVEGLNDKAKVTMRKSYGFRTYRVLELFALTEYLNWPSITHLASCLSRNQPAISSEEPTF